MNIPMDIPMDIYEKNLTWRHPSHDNSTQHRRFPIYVLDRNQTRS